MSTTPKTEPIADRTSLHYATLLAPIYRWMLGDLPSAIERSRAELRELGVGAAQFVVQALHALPVARLPQHRPHQQHHDHIR